MSLVYTGSQGHGGFGSHFDNWPLRLRGSTYVLMYRTMGAHAPCSHNHPGHIGRGSYLPPLRTWEEPDNLLGRILDPFGILFVGAELAVKVEDVVVFVLDL